MTALKASAWRWVAYLKPYMVVLVNSCKSGFVQKPHSGYPREGGQPFHPGVLKVPIVSRKDSKFM